MSQVARKNEGGLQALLQGVIGQAAQTPPKTGATAKAQTKVNNVTRRMAGASDQQIVLVDVSASMAETDIGGKTRFAYLQDALRFAMPPGAKLISFSTLPHVLQSIADLPAPGGTTSMHLALEMVEMDKPQHTLVISDGQPNDKKAALVAAEALTGTIDVIFVGDDNDKEAIAFMNQLARVGAGRVVVHDVTKQRTQAVLTQHVKTVLALPPKKA